MKKNKGFTLIELLVVIAIIGILASVVLAALSSARAKGADAAVQANLANARAQAELFYDSNATKYVGIADVCASGNLAGGTTATNGTIKGIQGMVLAASKATGGTDVVSVLATAGAWNQATCHSTADAWAAEAPLKASISATPAMYCVDSTGKSTKETAVLAASAVVCA